MAKIYERVNWENLPSKNTPVSAENLNKMDEAIDKLDDKIVELEENGGSGGDYLEKTNPTGTGSFSMNRKANTYIGNYSHAEGHETTASGSCSHAEGEGTTADGAYSHAEGNNTTANGDGSHAEGDGTIAKGVNQHVQGKFNVGDTEDKYAHIVGGGTSATDRKNIHTLDWEGNAVFAGDVTNGNGVSLDGLKTLVEEKTNTNDMTLVYTEAEELTELTSGEKLSTAFGKLAKVVKDLISHLADKVAHITSEERNLWNTVSNKADSEHTHNYAGSSSAGGAANSAKTLYHTRYIDGIPFDGSSNLSRLGTCTTATYMADKEVAISAFDDEGAQDAILYIQFTATYEGALNDAHAISINGGEPLTIYYKGEVFNWETYFSNYPFCEGQIHQFRYFWTPMGSYLELIAPQNRAVANNLTTTNEKIALAAPMGKQLAETDASLQEQIDTLNSNLNIHKESYDIETETGTEYQDCFVYTATEACFVLLNAASLYSNFMPTGIQIVTNSNVKHDAVFPYFYVISEGSGDWFRAMTSALVYLTPGSCVKVQQKISTDSGTISGAVSYIVIK